MKKRVSQKQKYLIHRLHSTPPTGIFFQLSFCFPLADSILTPKRIQLISSLIQKQNGQIIICRQRQKIKKVHYVLISGEDKLDKVMEVMHGKVQGNVICRVEWVQKCLDQRQLQLINEFLVWPKPKEQQQKSYKREQQLSLKQQFQLQSTELSKLQSNRQCEIQYKRQQCIKHQTRQNILYQAQKNATQNKLNFNCEQQRRFNCNLDTQQQKHQISQYPQCKYQQQSFMNPKSFILQPQSSNLHEPILKPILKSDYTSNSLILSSLNSLLKVYSNQKDVGRIKAYSKAIAVVRCFQGEIKTSKDVDKLDVGVKTKEKIKEIIKTGKLGKLGQLNMEESRVTSNHLCEVWGIGPQKAAELAKIGIKTVQQLRQTPSALKSLSQRQKIGLKYFQEFQVRIPRDKVTRILAYFKQQFYSLVKSSQLHIIQVCGSYRRLLPTCGDIDILITRKDGIIQKSLLVKLIAQLSSTSFLTQHLTHPTSTPSYSSSSYMGVCYFQSPPHHRIDIRYYPLEQFAYALLYFTDLQGIKLIDRDCCQVILGWYPGLIEKARSIKGSFKCAIIKDRFFNNLACSIKDPRKGICECNEVSLTD